MRERFPCLAKTTSGDDYSGYVHLGNGLKKLIQATVNQCHRSPLLKDGVDGSQGEFRVVPFKAWVPGRQGREPPRQPGKADSAETWPLTRRNPIPAVCPSSYGRSSASRASMSSMRWRKSSMTACCSCRAWINGTTNF